MLSASEPFILLTSVLFVYLGILRWNKDHKTAYSLLVFFTLIIFYLPILYYKLGFDVYSHAFSRSTLEWFTYISSLVIFIQLVVYLTIKATRRLPFKSFLQRFNRLNERKSVMVDLYFCAVMGLILLYLVIFRDQLPLYSLLTASELLERPDATGGIPMFFTFSSIYMVVAPSAYLYYSDRIKSLWVHIAFVLLVTVVLVAGGHKGLVAFFYIFIWFFVFKAKLSLPSIALGSFLLLVYGLTKGATSLDQKIALTLLESALRRFSVTQGVGFLARLEMVKQGLLVFGEESIKNQVYTFIYHLKGGSHPTMFIANVIIEYGYLVAAMVYTAYAYFVTLVAKSIRHFCGGNYFLLWNFFIVLFLTGMIDFSFRTIVRGGVALINVMMVSYLLRVKVSTPVLANKELN